MGFAEKLVRQCRKPQGFLGRFLGRAMNVGHARVRRWGLGYVPSESFVAVLDIGCGPGLTSRILLDAVQPEGQVVGVDFSGERIRHARNRYQKEGTRHLFHLAQPAVFQHRSAVYNSPSVQRSTCDQSL